MSSWGMPAATVLRIVFDTVALLGIDSDFRAFALTLLHVRTIAGELQLCNYQRISRAWYVARS